MGGSSRLLQTAVARLAARVVIATFVGLQLLLPLRYYLSPDPYDERFSWRMFSTVRVARCQSQAWERTETDTAPKSVRLSGGRDHAGQPRYGVIHNAWRTLIRRNRVAVIDAYLQHRCAVSSNRGSRDRESLRRCSRTSTPSAAMATQLRQRRLVHAFRG